MCDVCLEVIVWEYAIPRFVSFPSPGCSQCAVPESISTDDLEIEPRGYLWADAMSGVNNLLDVN
jgi:hypothetical protein